MDDSYSGDAAAQGRRSSCSTKGVLVVFKWEPTLQADAGVAGIVDWKMNLTKQCPVTLQTVNFIE